MERQISVDEVMDRLNGIMFTVQTQADGTYQAISQDEKWVASGDTEGEAVEACQQKILEHYKNTDIDPYQSGEGF